MTRNRPTKRVPRGALPSPPQSPGDQKRGARGEGRYTREMTPDDRDWAERVALRLAECGAEIRRLPDRVRHPRRAKLEERAEQYIELLARCRERLPPAERVATSLVQDRRRLNDLRSRFSRPTPENGLDFSVPPPAETASRIEQAAHEILRSLGL